MALSESSATPSSDDAALRAAQEFEQYAAQRALAAARFADQGQAFAAPQFDIHAVQRIARRAAIAHAQIFGAQQDRRIVTGRRQFLQLVRRQQFARVGVAGRGEYRMRVAPFQHFAAAQHQQSLRIGAHQRQVVADQQQGQVLFAAQIVEQVQDVAGDARVERGSRFVGDQHARLRRQRQCDGDALALAAGKKMRVFR